MAYAPKMVLADGTNDYISLGSSPTGAADSKVGTFVAFLDTTDGFGLMCINGGGRFRIRWQGGKVDVRGQNDSPSEILFATSSLDVDTGPVVVAASWDLAAASIVMTVNGVTDSSVSVSTMTDDAIDYTRFPWSFLGGSNLVAGRIAYIWLDLANDHDVVTNVADYWDGGPLDPGADGSNFFSTQPTVFLDRRNGVSDFLTDKGTAGDTWTENGAFADGGQWIQESIALAAEGAISVTAGLGLTEAITLPVEGALSVDAFLSLQEAITLASAVDIAASHVLVIEAETTFAIGLSATAAAQLDAVGSVTLPVTAEIAAAAGVDFNPAMTLAVTADMSAAGGLVLEESISLPVEVEIATAGDTDGAAPTGPQKYAGYIVNTGRMMTR